MLWFAFKFVSLTHQIHRKSIPTNVRYCCDLLLNLYLWHIKYTKGVLRWQSLLLWFAFKFVSLTHQIHQIAYNGHMWTSCDLLLNLYLWHIKYTSSNGIKTEFELWFAFKFVSLTHQIHHISAWFQRNHRCDLLLNLYLWHIKYTLGASATTTGIVVICF